jgi:hypothetical protein
MGLRDLSGIGDLPDGKSSVGQAAKGQKSV